MLFSTPRHRLAPFSGTTVTKPFPCDAPTLQQEYPSRAPLHYLRIVTSSDLAGSPKGRTLGEAPEPRAAWKPPSSPSRRSRPAPRLRLRACARQGESDSGAARSSVDDVVSLRGRSRRWLRRLSETNPPAGGPNKPGSEARDEPWSSAALSRREPVPARAGLRRASEPVQSRYGSNMVVWPR